MTTSYQRPLQTQLLGILINIPMLSGYCGHLLGDQSCRPTNKTNAHSEARGHDRPVVVRVRRNARLRSDVGSSVVEAPAGQRRVGDYQVDVVDALHDLKTVKAWRPPSDRATMTLRKPKGAQTHPGCMRAGSPSPARESSLRFSVQASKKTQGSSLYTPKSLCTHGAATYKHTQTRGTCSTLRPNSDSLPAITLRLVGSYKRACNNDRRNPSAAAVLCTSTWVLGPDLQHFSEKEHGSGSPTRASHLMTSPHSKNLTWNPLERRRKTLRSDQVLNYRPF